MKKIVLCSFLGVAMAMAAAGADVTGKWSGTISPDGRDSSSAYAILKQTGTTITGSAGPSDSEQWPELKGSIKGDKVTVQVTSASNGTTYKCELVLQGDHLKGDVSSTSTDGQATKGKMDLARVK
jgi:hypothetical protein